MKRLLGLLLCVLFVSACEDPVSEKPLSAAERIGEVRAILTKYSGTSANLEYKSKLGSIKLPDGTVTDFNGASKYLLRKAANLEAITKARYGDKYATKYLTYAHHALLQETSAIFADAHSSLSLIAVGFWDSMMGISLPGRAAVSTTGISAVERKGDRLVVKSLFPMFQGKTLGIDVGDEIVKINGMSPFDYVNKVIARHRNLGNPTSNFAGLGSRVFTRFSLQTELPVPGEELSVEVASYDYDVSESGADAVGKATAENSSAEAKTKKKAKKSNVAGEAEVNSVASAPSVKTKKVTLSFYEMDYSEFKFEIANATGGDREALLAGNFEKLSASKPVVIKMSHVEGGGEPQYFQFKDPTGRMLSQRKFAILENKRQKAKWNEGKGATYQHLLNDGWSFNFFDRLDFLDQSEAKLALEGGFFDQEPTALERWQQVASFPANYTVVPGASTFPAIIYGADDVNGFHASNGIESTKLKRSAKPGKIQIGAIWIESFSPESRLDDLSMRYELDSTIAQMYRNGVRHIVVDTIDNPGGSLALVTTILQAFSMEPINYHRFALGLNDQWIPEFEKTAKYSTDLVERKRAQALVSRLKGDREKGLRVSHPIPWKDITGDELMQLPSNLAKNEFNEIQFYVLVSSMNASCGDIFPDGLKETMKHLPPEQRRIHIIGEQTMGAGGNVVGYSNATPLNHGNIRMTESILIRDDNSGLENNGTKADVAVDWSKYTDPVGGVRSSALLMLPVHYRPGVTALAYLDCVDETTLASAANPGKGGRVNKENPPAKKS